MGVGVDPYEGWNMYRITGEVFASFQQMRDTITAKGRFEPDPKTICGVLYSAVAMSIDNTGIVSVNA